MKTKLVLAIRTLSLIGLCVLSFPANADTVYMIDISVGGLTAEGKITTDGFLGYFPDSTCCMPQHVLDWGITISSPGQSQMLSFANGHIGGLSGDSSFATPTQLLWNFDDPDGFFNMAADTGNTSLQLTGGGMIALQLDLGPSSNVAYQEHRSGWQPIAEVNVPSLLW